VPAPRPTPLPITGRPIRLAVVGLGQISELVLPTYVGRDDVEVVGLCDRDPQRLARWGSVFGGATTTTDLDELLRIEADVVDVLVPTPAHAQVVVRVLEAGRHVQVQKPIARDLEGADAMLQAAAASGAALRVMEDYLFFPPLVQLREIVASGELGPPTSVHMKIVANGLGGWEVPASSYRWQFEQAQDGRGMMVFDHGWHQLAVAHAMFGPARRVLGWIGATEVVPGIVMDAPSTLVWEHHNGVRAVLEISFAPDMYLRSDHYTGDERIEVTCRAGYARLNRISARGIQEPSVVVYRDGVVRGHHAIDDHPRDAFGRSTDHALAWFRGETDRLVMDGPQSREVLVTLLAAIESSRLERPVDVEGFEAGR
jgi:predicted dehydrogenase